MFSAVRQRHWQVDDVERPKLGHGGPLDFEANRKIIDFVLSNLKRPN